MENAGSGSLLRNRRLRSFFNTNSSPNAKEARKISAREEIEQRSKTDDYFEDDGWISALISCVRIVTCFVSMMVTTFLWALIMLLLLPWPYQRTRLGSIYGHVTGRMLVSCFGFYYSFQGCLWYGFQVHIHLVVLLNAFVL